jgi:GNAT superfamily N-acetyltransferase
MAAASFRTTPVHRAGAPVNMNFIVRPALLEEQQAIAALIARSIRVLGAQDYSSQQIEAALLGAFGVDTQLIEDGSYFVVEADAGDGSRRMVGCGGWSRRRTLFGSDARPDRDPGQLDPAIDAARIRAFFVEPDYSRQGIGRLLLQHCERAADALGFCRYELMATLPGVRLYAACGYRAGTSIQHPLPGGLSIEFVPMHKTRS